MTCLIVRYRHQKHDKSRPQECARPAVTAGGRDDFDSGSPLAGSKKANRATTDVWTTAALFSKSPPCNDCGGQRVSPEPRFCALSETGDLTE